MRTMLVVALAVMAIAARVNADGKIYYRERLAPKIPYQRAVLFHRGGRETLLLQSKFTTSSGYAVTNAPMGWVVPVPTAAVISSMKADEVFPLFSMLSRETRPNVVEVSGWLFVVWLLVTLVGFVSGVCSLIVQGALKISGHSCRPMSSTMKFVLFASFLSCVILLIMPQFLDSRKGRHDVDVLSSQDVGIYHATVITSSSSMAVIDWLNTKGFSFTQSDMEVFDRYVRKGWCFVTAMVRTDALTKRIADYEGMVDPLILSFTSPSPVYPLALTSTTGTNTELLIYLLADRRMDCGDRVRMWYANTNSEEWSGYLYSWEDTTNFVVCSEGWETNLAFLCKFKGVLTPAQMTQDLEFAACPDNKPYRKRIVRW